MTSISITRRRRDTTSDQKIDVLVGLDGSPGSLAGLRAVIELLGPRLGRLGLAVAGDMTGVHVEEARAAAVSMLAEKAPTVFPRRVEIAVLAGGETDALARHARERHYQVIALGTCTGWQSDTASGNVPHALATEGDIPVLLAGC